MTLRDLLTKKGIQFEEIGLDHFKGITEKGTCEVSVVDTYYIEEKTEILVQTTFNDTFGQIFKDAINALAKKEPNLTVNYDKYSGSYSDFIF